MTAWSNIVKLYNNNFSMIGIWLQEKLNGYVRHDNYVNWIVAEQTRYFIALIITIGLFTNVSLYKAFVFLV